MFTNSLWYIQYTMIVLSRRLSGSQCSNFTGIPPCGCDMFDLTKDSALPDITRLTSGTCSIH
jgi:hypothetical protein